MPPTEEEARRAVESLFDTLDGVEIVELSHEDHSEGYDHHFSFEATYPETVNPSEIPGQYTSIGGQFKWLRVNAGMNEMDNEGMEGFVRCYYGE